jgi:hypothetical protein
MARQDCAVAPRDSRVLTLEILSARYGGPTGLAAARWAVSRAGPVVLPLNPPLPAEVRAYHDLVHKNVFQGCQKPLPPKPANQPPSCSK